MDDVGTMKIIDAAEKIVKNDKNVVIVETARPGSCKDFLEIMIYVINDQKNLIEGFK